MLIELTTIPLYLYAAYSIDVNPDDYSNSGDASSAAEAKMMIIHVVVQEMLHLSLGGNVLCSLDGYMDLYDFPIIPQFPGTILFEEVELNLDRASQENLMYFKEVEEPDPDKKNSDFSVNLGAPMSGIVPNYLSIGDFYENLKMGLATLSDGHLGHNLDYQFKQSDFPKLPGLDVIETLQDAQNALELITEQGEGGVEVKSGTSHYDIFSALSANPPSWKVYNVPENPKTSDYKGLGSPPNFPYTLSLAFDAGYCYLLQNIQRVWGRGGGDVSLHNHLVQNMLGIMKLVMPSLADIILHQELTPQNNVAAPCFNYFPLMDNGKPAPPLEPEDLYSEFLKLINEATAIAGASGQLSVKDKLVSVADNFKTFTPHPESTT